MSSTMAGGRAPTSTIFPTPDCRKKNPGVEIAALTLSIPLFGVSHAVRPHPNRWRNRLRPRRRWWPRRRIFRFSSTSRFRPQCRLQGHREVGGRGGSVRRHPYRGHRAHRYGGLGAIICVCPSVGRSRFRKNWYATAFRPRKSRSSPRARPISWCRRRMG